MLKGIFLWFRRHEQGFSMLELMVYIGIIGVLVTFAIPKYTNTIAMANTAKIQSDLQTLDAAITMYRLQNGSKPSNITTDLAEYVAHADQLKPPTGQCMLKESGITDIKATEYVIDGEEAKLDGNTVDKFGKNSNKA